MLAEVTSNIGTLSVTGISSGVSMDFIESEEDARRYIWVPSMSDAFRTNADGGVIESSDVVDSEGARTSEARRSPPDTSLGLYRKFGYN
jgi:hypothetical protein